MSQDIPSNFIEGSTASTEYTSCYACSKVAYEEFPCYLSIECFMLCHIHVIFYVIDSAFQYLILYWIHGIHDLSLSLCFIDMLRCYLVSTKRIPREHQNKLVIWKRRMT